MAANKEVLIENRMRDQKDLGPIIVDGTEYHLILGSSDDSRGAPVVRDPATGAILPGTKDQFSSEFPNPCQAVPIAVWRAYVADRTRGPVIKAWANAAEISVDGRGMV